MNASAKSLATLLVTSSVRALKCQSTHDNRRAVDRPILAPLGRRGRALIGALCMSTGVSNSRIARPHERRANRRSQARAFVFSSPAAPAGRRK